jgi:hypothetical protein
MDLFVIAGWVQIGALAVVALFQLALVLGAPMGEYAFGGQHSGKLPTRFRIGSLVSIGLYLGIAGHVAAQLGLVQKQLPDGLNTAANWAIVGLMLVSLVMNGISRSKKERDLWVPVALLLVASSFIVALG